MTADTALHATGYYVAAVFGILAGGCFVITSIEKVRRRSSRSSPPQSHGIQIILWLRWVFAAALLVGLVIMGYANTR